MSINYFFKNFTGLFFIALSEGAIVMAVEILAGNILTAYFGNSIYMWSGILGISLAGLAIGYFAGARFSLKPDKNVFYALILAVSLSTAVIPFIVDKIMPSVLNFEIKLGITAGCIITIMPVMILCGMITPFIIQLISSDAKKVGKSAGTVYSVSTGGGILFTFLSGFLFIPEFGLRKSILIMSIVFLIAGLLYFFFQRKKIE